MRRQGSMQLTTSATDPANAQSRRSVCCKAGSPAGRCSALEVVAAVELLQMLCVQAVIPVVLCSGQLTVRLQGVQRLFNGCFLELIDLPITARPHPSATAAVVTACHTACLL